VRVGTGRRILRATPYALASGNVQGDILSPRQQCPRCPSVVGINMVHQPHNGLPEQVDYRAGSWRDVVGLHSTLVGKQAEDFRARGLREGLSWLVSRGLERITEQACYDC
jgi:hypothetical protein